MVRISKRVLCVCSVFLLFFLGASLPPAIAQFDNTSGTYNDFYQELANYGQWIEDPRFGYVWSPNVDGTFRPYYTNGYWAMTEYGNTWISEYPWGWACFHYGRWTYDSYYGWLWIPGSYWGPAWVSWRYGEGFYGWAPLGPNYELGITSMDYACPNSWWVFIPPQYLYSGNYYRYWYGPRGNGHIITNTTFVNSTTVIDGITYVYGPRQHDVEETSHQPVQVYHLAHSRSMNTNVHNNVVKMYHPLQIKPAEPVDGQKVAPPNVVHAPQPVKPHQPVKQAEATTPTFRNNLPKTGHEDPPGANINETAKPAEPKPNNNTNPYEYDVNRPVPQPRQDATPAPAPAPPRPQPQQNQPRQQPQQPAQPPRTQPAPQRTQTPTESPAPAKNDGRR